MKLPALENLDSIEEADRKFFDPTEDGKFEFNRGKFEAAVKAPLAQKNSQLLAKAASLKDLDEADIERIKKLKAKADKLTAFDEWLEAQDDEDHEDDDDKAGKDEKKPLTEKEIRAARQDERKRVKDEMAPLLKAEQDKNAALELKFEQQSLRSELTDLALKHGVIEEDLQLWMDGFARRFAREDGELVYLENGKQSTTITAEQAVRDVLFKEKLKLYHAREAGGGSGKGGKGNGKSGAITKTRAQFEKLNPAEASAFMAKVRKGEASLVD